MVRQATRKRRMGTNHEYDYYWTHESSILNESKDRVNREYFDNKIQVGISWTRPFGPKHVARDHESMRMAWLWWEINTIFIHRTFDRKFVIPEVIDWLVYHEMIHKFLELRQCTGLMRFHTIEFGVLERRFKHYPRVREWLQKNLDTIYRY